MKDGDRFLRELRLKQLEEAVNRLFKLERHLFKLERLIVLFSLPVLCIMYKEFNLN